MQSVNFDKIDIINDMLTKSKNEIYNDIMTTNTNNYYVYIYLDPRSNPPIPIYVGKGKGKRIYSHLNVNKCHNIILKSKIQHIREQGLEPIVNKLHENLSNEAAMTLEKELITNYGKIHNNTGTLCNFTDGGEGIIGIKKGPMSDSTKEKLRCIKTGTKMSKETKEKLRILNTGKKMTPDAIQRTRNAHLGMKRSKETCEKIGKSKLGCKLSEEIKRKISQNSKQKKSILQINKLNQIVNEWESIASCSNATGYNASNISMCCSHKRKTAYGFIWKFKSDTHPF